MTQSNFLYRLFGIILLTLISVEQAVSQEITAHLELLNPKHTYVEGEPIYANVTIKNNSGENIQFTWEEELIALDESGREITNNYKMLHYYAVEIKSDEVFIKTVNLNQAFGHSNPYYYIYLHPGIITLYVQMRTLSIRSNELKVAVKKGDALEDSLFQAFLNAREFPKPKNKENKKKWRQKQSDTYNKLTQSLTETVYDPLFHLSHIHFLGLRQQHTTRQYFELCDTFLREFPESPGVRSVILNMLGYFIANNKEAETISYFDRLSKQGHFSKDIQNFIDKNIQK